MRHLASLGLLGTLLIVTSASAQNLAPLPMGGRTGAMGGAGIAFGNDSAMAFLNPAGLSRIDRNTLSLSLSAYSLEAIRVDQFFASEDSPDLSGFDISGNDVRQSLVNAVPTSLAYLIHFGSNDLHQIASLGVMIPYSNRLELDGFLALDTPFVTLNSSASVVRSLQTYYIGPSYALELKPSFGAIHLGASVFLALSQFTSTISGEDSSGAVPPTEFSQIRTTRFTTGTSFDLVGVLGAQARFGVFSLGVSFHAPSLHLGGSFRGSNRLTALSNGVFEQAFSDTINQVEGEGDYEERLPMRLGFGLGLELERLTIGADVMVHMPLSEFSLLSGEANQTILQEGQAPINQTVEVDDRREQAAVVNFALGAEYRFTKRFAMRAGGFTDFSATELGDFDASSAFRSKIDRFGGVLGFAFLLGPSELSAAVSYVGGIGEIAGLDIGNSDANPSGATTRDALSSTISVLISGMVDVESMLGL